MRRKVFSALGVAFLIILAGCSGGGGSPTASPASPSGGPGANDAVAVNGTELVDSHVQALSEADSATIIIDTEIETSNRTLAQTQTFRLGTDAQYSLIESSTTRVEKYTNETATYQRFGTGENATVSVNEAPYDGQGITIDPVNKSTAIRFVGLSSALGNVTFQESGAATVNGTGVTTYTANSTDALEPELANQTESINATLYVDQSTGVIRQIELSVGTPQGDTVTYDVRVSAVGSTSVSVPEWVGN